MSDRKTISESTANDKATCVTIELSETAKDLLERIVESRFGVGAKSSILYDSTIEHLIHEEARKLKVTDQDLEELE